VPCTRNEIVTVGKSTQTENVAAQLVECGRIRHSRYYWLSSCPFIKYTTNPI